LKWLVDHGLVHAWKTVIRPGHIRAASIHLLTGHGARVLAQHRDDNPRPYIQRAAHALERSQHVVHDLEANQFFVDLVQATRDLPNVGLYHWVGDHGVRRGYASEGERVPLPDGWGRLMVDDRELFIHLEWDRGSEQTRRLHGKLQAYVTYFRARPGASCNHVLLVAPTDQREAQALRVAHRLAPRGHECCRIWTTTRERLERLGLLGVIWRDAADPSLSAALPAMVSRLGASRPIHASIGKPRWWEQRPAGGEGV